MKLYYKVFLLSLALILLAGEFVTAFVTVSSFKTTIAHEKDSAVSRFCYLENGLTGKVVYERMKTGPYLLPKDTVRKTLVSTISQRDAKDDRVYIYDAGTLLCSSTDQVLSPDSRFFKEVTASDDIVSSIHDTENGTFLTVGSKMRVEENDYLLFTVTDESAIYSDYRSRLFTSLIVDLIVSVLTAFLLLAIVSRMLRPLGQANDTLGAIAGGNYSLRLSEKGGYEFRELSRHVNRMADAVEHNVTTLESLAESRKRFTDNLAHEMKTPLTSILGFGDLLRVKKDVSASEREEYAMIIVEEAKRLQNLSGKLLELATSDNAPLEWADISVSGLFDEVTKSVSPLLSPKDMSLLAAPCDGTIRVDKELFKSLLFNLIENACKASEPGDRIWLTGNESDDRTVLTVRDEGIGMTAAQIKHIAEPFYMADKSRSRSQGGVGLGLSLCAEIAKRHHATITVSSAVGQGTTFAVTLTHSAVFGGKEDEIHDF